MSCFTAQELAEIAAADAEIEREFRLTQEEIYVSRIHDRNAKLEALPHNKRRIAERTHLYREAHKDEIAGIKMATQRRKRGGTPYGRMA